MARYFEASIHASVLSVGDGDGDIDKRFTADGSAVAAYRDGEYEVDFDGDIIFLIYIEYDRDGVVEINKNCVFDGFANNDASCIGVAGIY